MAEVSYATAFAAVRAKSAGWEASYADSAPNFTVNQRRVLEDLVQNRGPRTTGVASETTFAAVKTAIAARSDGYEDAYSKSAYQFDNRQMDILRALMLCNSSSSGLAVVYPEGSATLAASAVTLALTSTTMYVTGDAGGNTVATITGGVSGMRIILIFADGNVTLTDTSAATADTLNLSAAFTSSANDTISFVFSAVAGGKWLETSRSVN